MHRQSQRITEQAAVYFAERMHATPARRAEREAWLRADPCHAHAYADMERLWAHTGNLVDHASLQAIKAADLAALQRRRGWFHPMLAVAAVLLVLLGGGYWFMWLPSSSSPVTYATQLGERRTETLSDGTRVVLNTGTALQVRYGRKRREVDLQRGEAQFEVAHDAARPFVVAAGEARVTALGTRFQVRRDPQQTAVTLLEGKVQVAQGVEQRVLRPNEQARLSAASAMRVHTIDPALVDGWLDGWLRFRGVRLDAIVDEANRYASRKLRLGDPALGVLEMSGNFHAGDNASIALGAQLILPLRVDDSGTDIVLLPQ